MEGPGRSDAARDLGCQRGPRKECTPSGIIVPWSRLACYGRKPIMMTPSERSGGWSTRRRPESSSKLGVERRKVLVSYYAPRTRRDRECRNARTSAPGAAAGLLLAPCASGVCCPDAPCSDERPCLHLAFLTSREATVLRARLIRASNASEPHRRREVLGVPGACLTRVAAGPVNTGGRPRR
jgi:hypothetical protein